MLGGGDRALFMLDTEGCISMWPEMARHLYGHGAGDVIGRHLDMPSAERRGEPPPVRDLLAGAKAGPVDTDGR